MKPKNIFRLWVWANLMIGFWTAIFTFFQDELFYNDAGIYLLALGIGFVFSVPSLIILMIFQNFYTKKNVETNFVPYILIIVLINFLYLVGYYISDKSYDLNVIYFFFLTTFCGIVAFFIENNKVTNTNTLIKNDEIQ